MLGRNKKVLESMIKSLSISVSDLTNQVEVLKKELKELKKNYTGTKDLKSKK